MSDKFEQWAIVEVMGHQRYAGYVTEQAIGGTSFVRVDVPSTGPALDQQEFTTFLGSAAIFRLTPVSEEIARFTAAIIRAAPVHAWDLPKTPAIGAIAQEPRPEPRDGDDFDFADGDHDDR